MKTISLAAALLAAARVCAMLTPQAVSTRFPTGDVVIASQVVTAPADGTADAVPALQAAVDEAAAAGGAVLFLPAGRYRLASPLHLREGVTLRGDYSVEHLAQSTLLLPTAGRGSEAGPPAISADRGTGLVDLGIWYPEQSLAAPTPYPWCVEVDPKNLGDNMTLLNVTLVNPWLGVKVGPQWNELHTLRNVRGTPLRTGVFVDNTTDIGRLTDVAWSPEVWAASGLPGAPDRADLAAYLRTHATGCEMARSDWEYIYDVTVTSYQTGMVFHAGTGGPGNAVMFGCHLTDCGVALRLEGLNPVGLAVTGCTLAGAPGLLTTAGFTTVAQFNTCTVAGVDLVGRGVTTFQGCTFEAPVNVRAGAVTAIDCAWSQPGEALTLGPEVRRARVVSCRFNGAPGITDHSAGDVEIAHTPLAFDHPDVSPHLPSPDPRPKTAKVFDVTASGASSPAADNTAAFQAALDAAGAAGGGTVYVPAGKYRLAGSLKVPSGVELRGIFDVPHHTNSAGSVLMPLGRRGDGDSAVIELAAGSGLRGLTFWWPEQTLEAPAAYPWAARSMGPGCWAVDITLGNCWHGLDFASHDSTGHVVRYLSGGVLAAALAVSKCDGPGWVEDTLFNPHYCFRLPAGLPHPPYPAGVDGKVIAFQRSHLVGLSFGRCADEHIRGTFLYAGYDGMAFVDDGGGPNARVIMHGSDTVARSTYVAAAGPRGIEGHLFQLTPIAARAVGAFVTADSFSGRAAFYNSQVWGGNTTAQIDGHGQVVLQSLNTLTGPVNVTGGRCQLVDAVFERDFRPAVRIGPDCQGAWLLSNLAPGPLQVDNAAGERLWQRAASASPPRAAAGAALNLPAERFNCRTTWGPGQPAAAPDTVAEPGGGRKTVSGFVCRPVAGAGREGRAALRLAGVADDPAYSYVYGRALDGPWGVRSDTTLSYWLKPENALGQFTCLDIVFADGSTLRDSPAVTNSGAPARAAGGACPIGQWTRVEINLGQFHAGKVIACVMAAYDSRNGGGPFGALFADLELSSDAAAAPGAVTPRVADGRLSFDLPAGAVVRFTTDGGNPTLASPRYDGPLALGAGLGEVRWSRQIGERLAAAVSAMLVDGK
jgi:hypothetical protein